MPFLAVKPKLEGHLTAEPGNIVESLALQCRKFGSSPTVIRTQTTEPMIPSQQMGTGSQKGMLKTPD